MITFVIILSYNGGFFVNGTIAAEMGSLFLVLLFFLILSL